MDRYPGEMSSRYSRAALDVEPHSNTSPIFHIRMHGHDAIFCS